MRTVTVERTIGASPEEVFDLLQHQGASIRLS
jgi:uncharacterized protein YndB with AHSA1/START domain